MGAESRANESRNSTTDTVFYIILCSILSFFQQKNQLTTVVKRWLIETALLWKPHALTPLHGTMQMKNCDSEKNNLFAINTMASLVDNPYKYNFIHRVNSIIAYLFITKSMEV